MECEADSGCAPRSLRTQHGDVPHEVFDARNETALTGGRRSPSEVRRPVHCREDRDSETGPVTRCQDAAGHLDRIVVGLSVDVVPEVVEFGDGGESIAQKFNEQLPGDRFALVRPERFEEGVHSTSPCPERVPVRGSAFGQASHGALKHVRMNVRHARHRDSGHMARTLRCRLCIDRGDPAARIDRYADIAGPPSRKESAVEKEVGHWERV
jgi:hypothetical protein